jgi:hypothetical protein
MMGKAQRVVLREVDEPDRASFAGIDEHRQGLLELLLVDLSDKLSVRKLSQLRHEAGCQHVCTSGRPQSLGRLDAGNPLLHP